MNEPGINARSRDPAVKPVEQIINFFNNSMKNQKKSNLIIIHKISNHMKTKYDLKRLWLTRGVFALLFTMLMLLSGLVSAQNLDLTIYGPGSVTVQVAGADLGNGVGVARKFFKANNGLFPINLITAGAVHGATVNITALDAPFYQWLGGTGLLSGVTVTPNSYLLNSGADQVITASFYEDLTVNLHGTGATVDVFVGSTVPTINQNVSVSGAKVSIPGHVTVVNLTGNPAPGFGFYQWGTATPDNIVVSGINMSTDFGTPKSITLDTRELVDFTFAMTSRAYDGTPAVAPGNITANPTPLSAGFIAIAPGDFTYSDQHAAVGKVVTGNMVLTGDIGVALGNYMYASNGPKGSLSKPFATTGTITPMALTAASTVAPKAYDGSPVTGAVTLGAVTGLVGAETLNITPTASDYADANVGAAKATTISYALADGTGLATNYSMAPFATTGAVTAKALTAASTVAPKVYDGSPVTGAVTLGAVTGLVGAETLNITPTASDYADANVGAAKATTISYALADGTGLATNYSMAPFATTGAVTAKALTAASTVAPKVYDGSPVTGAVTLGAVTGLVGAETLNITPTASDYADANVGAAKATTISYALADGTGLATNYSMAPFATTGAVTAKALTAASTVAPKVYDGSPVTGAVTLGLVTGLVGAETLNITPTASNYADANVGAAKATTISYALADGTGLATNYSMAPFATTGAITAKALTAASTVASKVYDGSPVTGAVTLGLVTGLVGAETLNITPTASNYADANVGAAKATTISYALADGTGLATNYSMAPFATTGAVTAKALTAASAVANKVYDGSPVTGTVILGAVTGLVGTETLNITPTASNYADANVGAAKATTISYALADGTGLATNYSMAPFATTGFVTERHITLTANDATKVYGELRTFAGTEFGLTAGTFALIENITSLTLTSTGTPITADVIVSPFYPIVITELTGGNYVGANGFVHTNYFITLLNGALEVTLRPLTVVNAVAQNKVYDGNNVAVVTGAALEPQTSGRGWIGDNIFLQNHISGAFQPDGTVANGKPVTTAITLGGPDAGNYAFNGATSLTANITERPITITVTPGQSKVYGSTDPVFAYTSVAGPNFGLAQTDGFVGALERLNTSESVGTYSITRGTLHISGPNPGLTDTNYDITFVGANFEITPKQLTITGAVANNKTYDGNNAATVSGAMLVGAAFSDALTLVNGTVGTFDNENVGNSKVVTTNMTVTGAAIANYTQPVTPVLSANITPKALTATSVAAGKVYDGTTTAALTSALVGLVAGDDVTLTNGSVGTFASANIGTWAVSNTIGVTGGDVPNYTWTAPVVANAAISARPITVNVPMGQSKAYGQPDPVFAYSIGAGTLAPGQTWTGALSRQPGENVGTYNYNTGPLTITDAGSNNVTANYDINYAAVPAAAGSFAITPATTPLVITADNYTKFRCAADPTFTVTTTGLYFGDAVTAVLSRTPAGNDPGTYTINIDSYTVHTGNPANYSNISTVPGTLTIIDGPSNLVTNIVGFGGVIVRKQNGSVAAEIDGPVVGSTVTGFSFNEVITLEAVADNGYVFTGWTQDLTGMTNPGTLIMDCGKVVTATFKKVIYQNDIVVNAPNKIYDGNNLVVGGSASYNGILYGQGTLYQQPAPSVTWTSATYPNALVENNKLVTFSGLALVPNTYYQLAPGVVTQTTTSSITHKSLHVNNASVPARPYNGTNVATIVNAILNPADIVGTETLTLVLGNHTTGTFAGTAATGANSGANVSNGKNVTTAMTLTGPTAANYTLIQPTLIGDVTPRTLTFTAVSITPKVFDGVTPAVATVAGVGASTTWTGLISGDAAKFSVNVSGAAATFNNQWPGTGKPVTVTGGIAMSTNVGHTATYNAGNYEIVYPINTTGTILPPAYAMFTPTYAVNRPFVPVQNVPVNTPLSVEFSVNVVDINGDVLPTTDLGDFIDFQTYEWICMG
jgi:uncharacterized repeat protein (TIGR02543 family)